MLARRRRGGRTVFAQLVNCVLVGFQTLVIAVLGLYRRGVGFGGN